LKGNTFLSCGSQYILCCYLYETPLNFVMHYSKNILSIMVGCDKDFKYMSILRLGPAKGQRSLEQYTLDGSRREIRLEIDVDSPECGRVRMVKFLVRSAESADVRIPVGLVFRCATISNNWSDPGTHNAALLQEATVSIVGHTSRIVNTKSGRPIVLAHETSNATEAPETKRFNGQTVSDEKVTYFVMKVALQGREWDVVKRYKEFEALRNFLVLQSPTPALVDANQCFPGKSIWRVTGKGLDQRRRNLELYLRSIVDALSESSMNNIDVLSSFLEVKNF